MGSRLSLEETGYYSVMAVILASSSPRRIELLGALGIEFEVRPSRIDEIAVEKQADAWEPETTALAVARAKADAVAAVGKDVVIAADTIVFLDGISLGKPRDEIDAVAMLQALAGRVHTVTTGVIVQTSDARREGTVTARVSMRNASRAELDTYAFSGEPRDKAGGYAIQGLGGQFIAAVAGCYLTIVGLPICLLGTLLNGAGATSLSDPFDMCRQHAQQLYRAADASFPLPRHPPRKQ